ncbi:MAG: PhnD/SsuA/transferrin family substrate-binding protein [Acidimicrobiales bacterium]
MIARTTPASWQALDHTGADRPRPPAFRRLLVALGLLALLTTALTGCGSNDDSGTTADTATAGTIETTGTDDSAEAATFSGTLRIGAIPDQDPDVLQRQFGLVSDHLADQLGVDVEYVPVTDYQGAVSGFAVGDLDLVWFGGLTGVQARLEVDGARAIVQRDIDAEFTSVFITGADTGIEPISDLAGLSAVAGHSFTFGSESSTSGRLMPQYFLSRCARGDGRPGRSHLPDRPHQPGPPTGLRLTRLRDRAPCVVS